jgi:FAD/FMN-containing dehydrogenase
VTAGRAESSRPGLLDALREIVGAEACLARPEDLLVYEADGLTVHGALPAAVVLPRDKSEVARVVRACRAHGAPFVPRGAGTGLSGGAIALESGVVIECSRMNRILRVDPENRVAVVEPGVVNAELSKAAAKHGLFYAPDPSSQMACTLGGNVAENSGGPHTLKYGTTTQHVLALELVLPDGEIVRIGSPSGFPAGYDLVGAVVGGEGTLGVVTEITVRLCPLPERAETLLGIFPDVVSACRSVGAIIAGGLVPAALEIVDRRTIAAVEASVYAAGLPTDAGAVLLVELDGPGVAVVRQVERVRRLAEARARWQWRATPPSARASGAPGRAPSVRWGGSRPTSTSTTRWCRAAGCPRSWSACARSATATGCGSRTCSTPATATCTRTSPSTAATPTSCAVWWPPARRSCACASRLAA